MASNPTLLWFKRDLGVEDKSVVTRAAASRPLLPLYIVGAASQIQSTRGSRKSGMPFRGRGTPKADQTQLSLPLGENCQ